MPAIALWVNPVLLNIVLNYWAYEVNLDRLLSLLMGLLFSACILCKG